LITKKKKNIKGEIKMKTLKTKVVLSAFVLLFALVATIGSTFAWFTVSQTVTVQSMELNVKSEDSLLIRVYNGEVGDDPALLNAQNYFTTITNARIQAATVAGYADFLSWGLRPVTAVQADYSTANPTLLNNLKPIGDNETATNFERDLASAEHLVNNVTGSFIELDFWLLYLGAEVSVDVTLGSLGITSALDPASVGYQVINAIRLTAFEFGDTSAFVFARATDTPDYNFAFQADLPLYYDAVANLSDTALGFNALTVDQKADFAAANGVIDETVIATVLYNTPTRITVRIYVEGWDAQTTNNLINTDFAITFTFKIAD
jgi:hypothetical protein